MEFSLLSPKLTKIDENCKKWSKWPIWPKLTKITKNCEKWPKPIEKTKNGRNLQKLYKMNKICQNRQKWPELTKNDKPVNIAKMTNIDQNRQKWPKMTQMTYNSQNWPKWWKTVANVAKLAAINIHDHEGQFRAVFDHFWPFTKTKNEHLWPFSEKWSKMVVFLIFKIVKSGLKGFQMVLQGQKYYLQPIWYRFWPFLTILGHFNFFV